MNQPQNKFPPKETFPPRSSSSPTTQEHGSLKKTDRSPDQLETYSLTISWGELASAEVIASCLTLIGNSLSAINQSLSQIPSNTMIKSAQLYVPIPVSSLSQLEPCLSNFSLEIQASTHGAVVSSHPLTLNVKCSPSSIPEIPSDSGPTSRSVDSMANEPRNF